MCCSCQLVPSCSLQTLKHDKFGITRKFIIVAQISSQTCGIHNTRLPKFRKMQTKNKMAVIVVLFSVNIPKSIGYRAFWLVESLFVPSRAFEWVTDELCTTVLKFWSQWYGSLTFLGPGGPNFKVEPPFYVSVFLVWLVTSQPACPQNLFDTLLYGLCCKSTRWHYFFSYLSLLEAFFNAKIAFCAKNYYFVPFGCCKRPPWIYAC